MAGNGKVVGVRFSDEDLLRIRRQAELHSLDVSTYVRKSVLSRIEEINRILEAKTPGESLYEVKESLYALILDLKLNKKQ